MSWVRVPPEAARKSDCLGCAVLLCLVCLALLASFFLPSHLSFKNMYIVYTSTTEGTLSLSVCVCVSEMCADSATGRGD